MNILYQVRKKGRKAVAKEIKSWKVAHRKAMMMAWQIEELVHKALVETNDDARFLKRILEHAAGDDKKQINDANRFIQEYCDLNISIHNLLRDLIAVIATMGRQINRAAELDRATENYRRWKEDYPDLLAIAYTPVREVTQKRIAEALQDRSQESDLDTLFATEGSCGPN